MANGWQIAYRYEPAASVSGDYCDVMAHGEALYFLDGTMVHGRWVKESRESELLFFDDAGQPLVSAMTFAPLMYPGRKITVHKVWWDLERGVGTGQGNAQDIDPEITLEWSLDGGATFGAYARLPLSAVPTRLR